MKKLYTLIFFTLIVNSLFAQTFEKTFSGDGNARGYGIVRTFDGGYAIAGYMYANGITGLDLFIAKMDSNDNISWNKTYGGYGTEYTDQGFEQTDDSGFILLGYGEYSGYFKGNYEIIKTKSNGDTLWTKNFIDSGHSLRINNIHEIKDKGYILTGEYTINNVAYSLLIKIDSNGTILWSKLYTNSSYGSTINQYIGGYDVAQSNDGGFVISCYGENTYGSKNDKNAYLVKTDSNGNKIWANQLNLEADGGYSYIQRTNDEGFVLTEYGYSTNFVHDSTILLKIDSAGNVIWRKNYYTFHGSVADLNLNKTDDGNYILSGALLSITPSGSSVYGHVIKVNNNGDTLLTKGLGILSYDTQLRSSYQTKEKGIISTGFTEDSIKNLINAVYIVKTDSTGFTNCNSYYNIIKIKSETTEEKKSDVDTASITLKSSSWFLIIGSAGAETDLCSTSGINKIRGTDMLSLYPNPTDDIINISFPSSTIIYSLQVFDLMGRNIISQSFLGGFSSHYSLNMSNQVRGYYLIRLNSSQGIINRSFVLE